MTAGLRKHLIGDMDPTDPITYAALAWIGLLAFAVLTPWRWLFRVGILLLVCWLILPVWGCRPVM
jgi:hypothetical protein